ncbi:rRNA processing/ribosome biogenesis-domain-containing protein [Cerioporus squamosus]|nr:rRNA processing/ribosome biogenesis-domain-containing protein [Cerioporus squamosus]
MEQPAPRLKDFLQVQLASDAYAVLHLPFVLETLTKSDFLPSAHTQKWIARVNSLIHSKDPAAKWSGLCLAHQTALFSRDIMLESAQSWVGAAIPLLMNQPAPTTKAAMRLLRQVFSSAMDVPEFQRQLCTPNVPKFANALIALAEKETNPEVYLLAIDTLTHVVTLYPSLCRPLHGSLSTVALRHLNGSSPTPAPSECVEACSRLYAVLPLTGGKVNAPNLWRKSLDDTVAFAWGAFLQLRTTSPDGGYGNFARPAPSGEDPVVAVPLALDRLRAAVQVIKDILSTPTSRPVSLPLGALVRLCSALLQCSPVEKADAHVNHVVRSLETSAVPTLWKFACELLAAFSQAGHHHVTPHVPMLLTHLAFHLEQSREPAQTLRLLHATSRLLNNDAQLHDNIVASRLARSVMPLLAVVLAKRSTSGGSDEQGATQGKGRKGKKRARGYEGDEVFKVGRELVCVTATDSEILLASVDVLESLLLRTPVNPPVHSIASRLFLSVYASLPQLPPALLSPDLSLHPRLYAKLQRACVNLAIGTTSTMSKSLGLMLSISNDMVGPNGDIAELLLHPRVPPLVRSLPHVELLSLFRAEEGEEEMDTRTRVGLTVLDEPVMEPDVAERLTPHAEHSNTSNTPRPHPEVGRNSGSYTVQEPMVVPMHVDVSPAPTPPTLPPQLAQSSQQSIELQAAPIPTLSDRVAQNPLPPPPDPLPSNSAALGPPSTTSTIPPVTTHIPQAAAPTGEEDDDDEPMPTIDLGSDSDSD